MGVGPGGGGEEGPSITCMYVPRRALPVRMEEGDGDGVLGHPQTSTAGPAVQRQGDGVVGDDQKHKDDGGRHGCWCWRGWGGWEAAQRIAKGNSNQSSVALEACACIGRRVGESVLPWAHLGREKQSLLLLLVIEVWKWHSGGGKGKGKAPPSPPRLSR